MLDLNQDSGEATTSSIQDSVFDLFNAFLEIGLKRLYLSDIECAEEDRFLKSGEQDWRTGGMSI